MTDSTLEETTPEAVTPVAKSLLATLDRLYLHPLCLEIISENMLYQGGIERFIQRLFLWAFHTLPAGAFSAAMELCVDPLVGNEALDLVVYQSTTEVVALMSERKQTSADWFNYALAIVEMKDNWNRASIKSDVAKIQRIRGHCLLSKRDEHEYYELLFIHNNTFDATFDLDKSIKVHAEKTLKCVLDSSSDCQIIGRRTLLNNVLNPSDGSARTSFVAVLVRLHFSD